MVPRYRNAYFALRHGISLANEQGIVLSHPENGTRGWGLSETGQRHSREMLARESLAVHGFSPGATVTISSDFCRASETAAIFCELNSLPPPRFDPRLRERYFGDLENQPQTAYLPVWERDAIDPTHHLHGCESTDDVAERLSALLRDIESQFDGRQIVLVSHGDPLQILETIFLGLASNQHRTLEHMANAEIRRLH